MNTTHHDETSDGAAAAHRLEEDAPSGAADQPDMREIRGKAELQGMPEDGDRYEQMREPDSQPAATPDDQDALPAALFAPPVAERFKALWADIEAGLDGDPGQAVRQADELVAQVMKNLAETFADERANVESEMDQGDTEHMRVALRRYRSFFQRLLSL